MATLAVGVPVNVYYSGPNGNSGQAAGTVSDLTSGYITVTNSSGSDITIGWENVHMAIS